jgi:hypothetical protein
MEGETVAGDQAFHLIFLMGRTCLNARVGVQIKGDERVC